MPSLPIFDTWHYMSECAPVNGYPRSANPCPQQDRLDRGIADEMLVSLLRTFSTTHSTMSASFALRMVVHITGDVHQPLHAMDGVDVNHPGGDIGGNARRFQRSCNSTNLHALWDSGGGRYPLNWVATRPEWEAMKAALLEEAAQMAADHAQVKAMDDLFFAEHLHGLAWEDALRALGSAGGTGLIRQMIGESARIAQSEVYARLQLNPATPGGLLPCPGAGYFANAGDVSAARITVGGYRLSFLLKLIASQLREHGLMLPQQPDGALRKAEL